MLKHDIVMHGKVAGSLVGHMNIMSLMDETDECATHRDHVVVRVRGEDEDFLRERS